MEVGAKRRDATGRRSEHIADDAAAGGVVRARTRLEGMIAEGRVKTVGTGDDPFVVDRRTYLRHSGVLDMVRRRASMWSVTVFRELLDKVLDVMGFTPDELQMQAIVTAIESPLSTVHGGPGTGKSTIIRVMARYLEAAEAERTQVVTSYAAKIALTTAARAAVEGRTLHSLTGTRPDDEEAVGTSIDPATGTIYVDEAFATPPGMLHRLLRQAPSDTRIVFIGDPAQLPPIGEGRILHDILANGEMPSTALRTSHRMGANGHLAEQAARVAGGLPPREGPGLVIVTAPADSRKRSDMGKALCASETRRRLDEGGLKVVVLTMTRHGACGHEAISRLIARRDAPDVGDAVITTQRSPDGAWRNGQSGRIEERVDDRMRIRFDDGTDAWTRADDGRVTFGYAMSVHRAQGLEYDHCILVLRRSDIKGLSRQALVSAMTRAPNCTVITDGGVLEAAVLKDEVERRAPIARAIITRRDSR